MVNLNATQFQKQDVLRTVTVGFQPYMPFSQQYAMSLRQQGEPGYFEISPQPLSGNPMLPTTGKGKEYSFETRMRTYMGKGEGGLAHMSRYHSPDRATQVANSPPQGAGSASTIAGRQLSKMFESKMDLKGFKFTDVGEQALGTFSESMDKEMGGDDRTSSQYVNRGVKRSAKFWGNDFDIKLEQTDPVFREFLEHTIGKEEMEGVHSLEMTRAKGNSTTNKLLSMSQKELGTNDAKQGRINFKKHVDSKLAIMNTKIKDAVIEMAKSTKSLEKYEAYRVNKVGGSSALAARGLIMTNAKDIVATTIRDFLGKTTRSNMIAQIEGSTEPAKHLYQVRLGKRMLGFALISAKSIRLDDKISYPKLEVAPKVMVIETLEGANHLINAYGDFLIEQKSVDVELVSSQIAKANDYANNIAVLTEDRVAHMYHSASVSAAEMVRDNTGLTVGDTVQSNIRLLPMDIAENLRQQMILHFTKGGASRKFAQWYNRLFDKSNILTKAWYSSIGMVGKRGGSFSEEWTYGDDKGNPNKRFLGVWSKASQDTWKNDVGRNVSLSPFIISRRKGVAAFRTGGEFGND